MRTQSAVFGLVQVPQHPIYLHHLLKIRPAGRDPARVLWTSLAYVLVAFTLIVVGVATFLAVSSRAFGGNATLQQNLATGATALIVAVAPALGFAFSAMLNYVVLSHSVNIITNESIANRWELTRLAVADDRELLAVKLASARALAWRNTTMTMILQPFMLGILAPLIFESVFRVTTAGWLPFVYTIPWIIALVLVIPAFALGPLWRLNLLSALGVGISARTLNRTTGSLAAMGIAFGFVVVQLFVAYGVLFVLEAVGYVFLVVAGATLVEVIYWPVVLVVVAWLPYLPYRGLRVLVERWALRGLGRG